MKKNLLDINSKENVDEIMRRVFVLESYVKLLISKGLNEHDSRRMLMNFYDEFKMRL